MALPMVVQRTVAVSVALVALTVAFIAGTGSSATATQGQAVIAGDVNSETTATSVVMQNSGAPCEVVLDNHGFVGCATTGLVGWGSVTGVKGGGPTGVEGFGTPASGAPALNGVYGHTNNAAGSGVYGANEGTGYGVAGRAVNGTGVLADSANGTALNVQGTLELSRSGRTTVPAGQLFKQVSLTNLSSKTFIIATVQGGTAGVWVQRVAVTPASGSFRIYLNKAATVNTKVGWFAIN
jgi:hypothetical protein